MVDCVKYPVKYTDGYAGNSLLEKNILFCIKSDRSFGNEIEAASQTDSFNYKVLKIKDIEEIESISEENSVLGTYDKIMSKRCYYYKGLIRQKKDTLYGIALIIVGFFGQTILTFVGTPNWIYFVLYLIGTAILVYVTIKVVDSIYCRFIERYMKIKEHKVNNG